MMNQIIGKNMFHGYAGDFARQPDTIIDTHCAGEALAFGQAVVFSGATVITPTSAASAADFAGVVLRETKTALNYLDQNVGSFAQAEPVPVLKRGCANVLCQLGDPAFDGSVYMRVESSASYPTAVIGGFEASADSTNNVLLTNVKWKGTKDANGVAEIRILTNLHA